MACMSSTLLRRLARHLVEAACRAVVFWAVDKCNSEPPTLRSRRASLSGPFNRFATKWCRHLHSGFCAWGGEPPEPSRSLGLGPVNSLSQSTPRACRPP